jgi:hypothetical protein
MSINANLYITTKGGERLYSRNLYLMKSIDLSGNDFTEFLLTLELLWNSWTW